MAAFAVYALYQILQSRVVDEECFLRHLSPVCYVLQQSCIILRMPQFILYINTISLWFWENPWKEGISIQYNCLILYFVVSGKKASTPRAPTQSVPMTSVRSHSAVHSQYRDSAVQQPHQNQNQPHMLQTPVNRTRKSSTTLPNSNDRNASNSAGSPNTDGVPSYMRSTSSSTKKSLSSVPMSPSTQYQHPQLSGYLANRHSANRAMIGQAQSTSDIRQAMEDEDSSSDDDTSSLNPTRRRSSSHDR